MNPPVSRSAHSSRIWIRDSAPSHAAQAFLREHPDVRADLGEDIALDGMLMGRFLRAPRLPAGAEAALGEIIQAWTQYLEVHPNDDVALLERAGTWHHQGNDARGLEDL